jgi:hypothetical protein
MNADNERASEGQTEKHSKHDIHRGYDDEVESRVCLPRAITDNEENVKMRCCTSKSL